MPNLQTNRPSRFSVLGDGTDSEAAGRSTNIGTVLIVLETNTAHPYVEKQFDRTLIARGFFRDESRLLTSLWHNDQPAPCIQNLQAVYQNPQKTHASIWLDYCDQGSLYTLAHAHADAQIPLPEKFIWKAFYQMTKAVEYLHRGPRPIIHRNLTPKNVLFVTGRNGPPDIRVTGFEYAIRGDGPDFDVATSLDARATPRRALFCPPEHPHYYMASDVWQIAKCIFQVTKEFANNPEDDEVAEYLSPPLRDAIKCCLVEDPWKRPTAAQLREMMFYSRHNEVVLGPNGVLLFPGVYRGPV